MVQVIKSSDGHSLGILPRAKRRRSTSHNRRMRFRRPNNRRLLVQSAETSVSPCAEQASMPGNPTNPSMASTSMVSTPRHMSGDKLRALMHFSCLFDGIVLHLLRVGLQGMMWQYILIPWACVAINTRAFGGFWHLMFAVNRSVSCLCCSSLCEISFK
jgi:hypothetical protein